MNSHILYPLLLILHLTGLTLMAASVVAELITFKFFSTLVITERERSLTLLSLLKKLSALLIIGAALLVPTGVGLLIITKGLFTQQLWFKVKLAIIFTLTLNGALVGGRQKTILANSISGLDIAIGYKTETAIRNIKMFYMVQASLFFVIIFLSVFKFN